MIDYTAEQASTYLQVHKVTIYKWAEAGKLPGRKLNGRLWRFTQDALDSFGLKILPKQTEVSHVSKTAPTRRHLVLPI
jgi:excisionase family DNA binding protein